jgi:hypothetical protein
MVAKWSVGRPRTTDMPILAAVSRRIRIMKAPHCRYQRRLEETSVLVGTTLARLADEFVATLSPYGIAVDRQAVEQEMRDRIADIADRLRVDSETVLREHARPGWGREMATDALHHIESELEFEAIGRLAS